MGNDDISLVSTTDSAEEVTAALTGVPVPEKKADEPPPAAPAADAKPDAGDPPPSGDPPPPANETPEQKAERERVASGREKRKNKIQSEIDELTRQKHDLRRDNEAFDAQKEKLSREIAELEAKKAALAGTPPAPKAETSPAAGRTDAAPDVADDPGVIAAIAAIGAIGAEPDINDESAPGKPKYANYEEYLKAHAAWTRKIAAAEAAKVGAETEARLTRKTSQAERERIERESALRDDQNALALYTDKFEEFKGRTPDVDAVLESAQETITELVEEFGRDVMNVVERYTVRDADNGPAIQYYLAQNPDEMRRIVALPVPLQLAALGKLDNRLEAASKEPARPPQAPPVTQAPEPIKPVGSTPTASTVSPEDEPYHVYKARRDREEREARGLVAR